MANPMEDVLFSEGEKKVLAATLCGIHFLGLCGIWMWVAKGGSKEINPELRPLLQRGRKFVMVYDSDAANPRKKTDFERCSKAFATSLARHGCELWVAVLPSVLESGKTGVDDFLLHRTQEELRAVIAGSKRKVEPELRPSIALPGKGRELRPVIEEVSTALNGTGGLYVHGDEIAYLEHDAEEARLYPLSPVAARSVLEEYCQFGVFDRKSKRLVPSPISESDAKAIINSPLFKHGVPQLKLIVDHVCPTWNSGLRWGAIGATTPGYDAGNCIWTCITAPAMEAVGSVENSIAILCELLQDFCFEQPGGFPELHLNMAIAYLLSCHCRLLIEPDLD